MLSPKLKNFAICFVGVALSLSSCVNLRHISEFSKTSIEGIEQYDSLSTSFFEVCLQDARQESIRKFDIHHTEYDCEQNNKADSITKIIYKATQSYFDGLSDLSQNELTNYNTDNLTQTLATGDFGPLKLNETDVKAYSDISTLLLRAITDTYRRKKLKEYITQAHGPLLKLLQFLELNLEGNLTGKLNVQKSSLKNFYFDFVKDKRLSTYERTKFAEDYFRRISEIDAQQKELQTLAEILREISKGHQSLYNNSGHMTDKQVRKELLGYGSQMENSIRSLRNM
ncbi:MAG TPA: hypothetical protein ENH87_10450 [Pricia antarctica]|uniref:Lipoprotein n=1 Tax=Pricia antarctica TaxID=641691 RepID=A0A831QQ86_9FLAO|nr:hypothetical protein [Pricia antarctica]